MYKSIKPSYKDRYASPNDTLILKTLTSDNTNMTDSTTKYLFFTGKGGVGKTSLALQQL
jgi:hypothetical protein